MMILLGGARSLASIAPGSPGISFPRQTSEKQGFGTSFGADDQTSSSRVWFTIARGIVTEVFFPRIDSPQTRDTQILITDGKSFIHQEQFDTVHEVHRDPVSPLYHIKNTDRWHRYEIDKDVWVDPDSDTLIQQIHIQRFVDGLKFFALHKPMAGNSLFDNTASTVPGLVAGRDTPRFGAWQGLVSSLGFGQTSVGYVGVTDGYQDLTDFKMDYSYTDAPLGNVALTGELPIPATSGATDLTLFLTFGATRKEVEAELPVVNQINLTVSREEYVAEWSAYLRSLNLPVFPKSDPKRRELAISSALILKSGEDKTYRGSVIASPSFPWGEKFFETGVFPVERTAGYSVVWPRDVYHIAGAYLALGDGSSAVRVLNRLRSTQFGDKAGEWNFPPRRHDKKGSFPQNFWVDSQPLYGGYQADETAMPILLTYRLWKAELIDLKDYWDMVREAASFLVAMGPWTQTERWEENYGISPNTAANVISSLVAASEIAFNLKETNWGSTFLTTADGWATKPGDNIDTWTFTTNGKIQGNLGNGRYYLRLAGAACDKDNNGAPKYDAVWNPNFDELMCIANYSSNERFKYESEIVDAGFLTLSRLGVRSAMHPLIRDSLQETDALLKKETPGGPGWYRYRFDGYGESARGRLWPILTGERIHYELQWLKENHDPNPSSTLDLKLQGLESFASDMGIFSEQVWDEGPTAGKPTGSASPLLWSHAEYIQLLKSLSDGKIFDEIATVRARYGSSPKR